MGHFTIGLPGVGQVEVRAGKVIKKTINLFGLFRKKGRWPEERTGYIVEVGPDSRNKKIYYLLRSKGGEWLTESDGGFQVTEEDEISRRIKQAIEEFEHREIK